MYGYAAASAAATSQMTPFTPPHQCTNTGGLAGQPAAVGHACGGSAQHLQTFHSCSHLTSAVPHALYGLTSPPTCSAPPTGPSAEPPTGLLAAINGIMNGRLPQYVSNAATLLQFGSLPGICASMWATTAASWGVSAKAVAPPAAIADTPAGIGFVSGSQPLDVAVIADLGKAATVGGISVPPGGVGEQVLGRWVRLDRQVASGGDTGAVPMLMNAQSWSVCARKTPNYVWTVSF